jgi:DNA topoisomerase IA
MTAAEELYQQGLISYPRTETERFQPEFQHLQLIESFRDLLGQGNELADYASKLLTGNNFQTPKAGPNDDKAHPPITPCRAVDPGTIGDPTQRSVYLLVVKHYFACCSRDALGKETGECNISLTQKKGLKEGLRGFFFYVNYKTVHLPLLRNSSEASFGRIQRQGVDDL